VKKRQGPSATWSPIDKARFNTGVTDLHEQLAHLMLAQVEERLGKGRETEEIMEFVLDLNEIEEEDRRHAYKKFFGYTWVARGKQREAERNDAFNREFAPLEEDGY